MKLWKVDVEAVEVREVEAEPYPGRDEEGESVYENTHFADKALAVARLGDEIKAGVRLAGRSVIETQGALRRAEGWAGKAAADYQIFVQRYPEGKA